MLSLLERTYVDATMNLAVDEALLDSAEAEMGGEVLRLWEFPAYAAVIGRGSRIAEEVDLVQCSQRSIPVLRRCSGGASIVAGPGCLMYSLVLSMALRPALRHLDRAHAFVMGSLTTALGRHLEGISVQGTCDLTWGSRKFSGNSVRVARDHLLYHGTLLYEAELETIASCLKMPPRKPEYRQDRDHRSFLINLPLSAAAIRQAVRNAFPAEQNIDDAGDGYRQLEERAKELVLSRYSQHHWNYRH